MLLSLHSSSYGPVVLEAETQRLASGLPGLSVTWHKMLLLRQVDFDNLRLGVVSVIGLPMPQSLSNRSQIRLLHHHHHPFNLCLTAAGGLALMFGKAVLVGSWSTRMQQVLQGCPMMALSCELPSWMGTATLQQHCARVRQSSAQLFEVATLPFAYMHASKIACIQKTGAYTSVSCWAPALLNP